jgi:hypothetical protein
MTSSALVYGAFTDSGETGDDGIGAQQQRPRGVIVSRTLLLFLVEKTSMKVGISTNLGERLS